MRMKMNKKKMLTAAAAALCLAVMAGCGGAPVAGSTSGSASTASSAVAPVASPSGTVSAGIAGGSGNYITEEQARAAALEHAGVAEADARFLSVRLDYDDGRAEYDVEFLHGTEEYDYTIGALTGEVLSMDRDAEYSGGAAQAASGDYIGEEAAQQAALAHAGLDAASVNFVRTHLDWDDGRWKYEVEFYKDNTEYDYDIDALTGSILSYDYDAEYYTAPATGTASGASLTAEQAKQIALQHAGVAEADTSRMEIGFDYENGRAVYELEWRVGWTEYSYEVDANTGDVLSYERDVD